MKKLSIIVVLLAVMITACSNNTQSTETKSNATNTSKNYYITVKKIELDDLLNKISAKEDFSFVVTRQEECGLCREAEKILKTFESEDSVIYHVDIRSDEEEKLLEKLSNPNYSKNKFKGYPSIYFYNKDKQLYYSPDSSKYSGFDNLLRQQLPRRKGG